MELSVRGLIRLLDALHALDDVKCLDEPRVKVRHIANTADDCLQRSLRLLRIDIPRPEKLLEMFNLRLLGALLDDDDHGCCSFFAVRD